MIVKVVLDQSVGFLQNEQVVMAVHMNNVFANLDKKKSKLSKFWDFLYKKVTKFKVQVLMGDFNMCLFRVIPELRSRGVVIDLIA